MEPSDFDLSDPAAAAFCSSCGAGYTSQARDCGDCGVALVSRSQIESELEQAPDRSASLGQHDADVFALCPGCGTQYTSASLQCIRCRIALVPSTRDQESSRGGSEAIPPGVALPDPDDADSSADRRTEPGESELGTSQDSWARRHFTGTASLWTVVGYGSVSALATAYTAAELLRGETDFRAIAAAVFFSLFAVEHWRRWNAGKWLPRRFRCPDCDAWIQLTRPERALTSFSCKSCGEDFEVEG